MDFRLSDEQGRLRGEVCEFLTQELGTTHLSDPRPMPSTYLPDREFEMKLGERGWLALSWPEEYGGGGRPVAEQFIVEEEVARHGGPASDAIARVIVAPLLLLRGSEDQKRRYLPRLARGEITFCLGYTESESGSDLASLQTRADADGDDYVINGRKLYSSGAERSEYCWLAARTDPGATKHGGVSVLIVPMDSPGVEVRPLVNMVGEPSFNEIVFEDVRVPRHELVGGENQGWEVLTAALGVERITIYRAFAHLRTLWALVRHASEEADGRSWADPVLRQRLSALAVEFEVARLLLWRAIGMHERGEEFRAQAAMVKLFNSELTQRLYAAGVNALGPYGQLLRGERALWEGAVPHEYLSTVQDTIGAGTSEVQREIVAIRGLGLPRG
jgi:alkylation response protein AidB-like acyl-CoA dehydrogenase